MGSLFGGGKTTQNQSSTGTGTTTPTIPNWLQPTIRRYFNQVGGLLDHPAQSGRATGLQRQAWNGASGLGGPNYDLAAGANATRGLLGYAPDQVTAGQLSQTDLSPYMNPFQQGVIDTTMRDLERGRQGAITQGQAAATQAGAFGGSRHGVADALTNREFFDSAGATLAGLNAENFNQAQGAASFDIGNRLGADQFNSQQGLAGAQFRLGAAGQLGEMGLAGDANRRANLGLLSDLGREQWAFSDPRYMQLQKLQSLLGINAGDMFGNRVDSTSTSTGTAEDGGNLLGGLGSLLGGLGGLGWSPFGGK